MRSSGGLAPANLVDSYGDMGALIQGKFKTLHLSGGYAYTWVFVPEWYFHIWLSLGFGPQHQFYEVNSGAISRKWTPASKGVARASIGYNGDDFFWGLNTVNDSTGFTSGENPLQFDSLSVFLFFGIRI